MKRRLLVLSILLAAAITIFIVMNYFLYQDPFYFVKGRIEIEKVQFYSDMDKDGLNDLDDIVQGARKEIENHTKYKSAYYAKGYPPENEGVCTDVVWRALMNAGYNLKDNLDKDIKENLKDYEGSIIVPDPNIDFRRVKNQQVFFKKYAEILTLEVIPYNKNNLRKWQAGDIVVLKDGEHVAIISDKRRKDGVPYVIHNASTYPMEQDMLMSWYKGDRIIGHFRFPKI